MTRKFRTRATALAGALLTGISMVSLATGASAAAPAFRATVEDSGRLTIAASSYHEIVNYAYNQCLEAPGGTLNVRLRLAGCNGSGTQKWAFVAAPSANTYYLVNRAGGFCAEVNNGTSSPGEAVDEYYCNGTAAEQWVQSARVISGLLYQHFTHSGTALCLDTVGGAGSQLMQWYCTPDNDAQTWLVR
jgi:hypothetical protein